LVVTETKTSLAPYTEALMMATNKFITMEAEDIMIIERHGDKYE